jgi:hypothetical protein
MSTTITASLLAPFLLLLLIFSASAQVQRTFVSGLGSDSNPCSRTAPCRNFAQAISQTNPGGEVVVLDSAGYGVFAIAKAVSIIAPPGVYAGVSVFSGDGIDINAGGSVTVILRGLTVNNQGSAGRGILFNAGGTLHIENCVINGFSNAAGLGFLGAGSLEVKDSIMRGNDIGIVVWPSSGTARAAIDRVRLEGGAFGLVPREGSVVTVRNSVVSHQSINGFHVLSNTSGSVRLSLQGCVASNNENIGIFAWSTSTGSAEVDVESCIVSGNAYGVVGESDSTGVATVRLSNTAVTGNDTGLAIFGPPALILSRGNSTVEGNTLNSFGTIGSYNAK